MLARRSLANCAKLFQQKRMLAAACQRASFSRNNYVESVDDAESDFDIPSEINGIKLTSLPSVPECDGVMKKNIGLARIEGIVGHKLYSKVKRLGQRIFLPSMPAVPVEQEKQVAPAVTTEPIKNPREVAINEALKRASSIAARRGANYLLNVTVSSQAVPHGMYLTSYRTLVQGNAAYVEQQQQSKEKPLNNVSFVLSEVAANYFEKDDAANNKE